MKTKKNANDKICVFGYVRVSTDNQLENYSIDEQVQRLKLYCAAKDWIITKIYTDGGFSGGNISRPALQQMIKDIHKGGINAVVVYKLDRLSRSQKDTLSLIEDEFLPYGTDFISICENFDTSSPFGKAMLGILAVFAELEKDQITERFTMGRIGRSKAGYYHGGVYAPIGYIYVDGNLIIDEYKALQVKEVFALFLKGSSINAIRRIMHDKYDDWSATTVRNVLKNSTYTGKVKFKGVEYPGNHQPIIDQNTFAETQRLLSPEVRDKQLTTAQKTPFRAGYLLSSLVFCAKCSAGYSADHGFYKCYSRSKSNQSYIKDPNCKNKSWAIEKLDELIIQSIFDISADNNALQNVMNTPYADTSSAMNKDAVTMRLKEIDKQLSRLIELYQLGSIPMTQVTDRVNQLSTEKERLEEELLINADDSELKKQTFLKNLAEFEQSFEISPLEARRLLISSLIEAILINDNEVIINWRV